MDGIKVNYIKEHHVKEIYYCLLAGFISLIAVYFFYGLKGADLNVPIGFIRGGDIAGPLVTARNFINGNGKNLYPNMGAPGVVFSGIFPDNSNIHYFILWLLSFFIKEPGLLLNIYYILTFWFIAISTVISLRLLKISPVISILGGVLYSLLFYHFYEGIGHIFLSAYAIVPFVCVMILWIIKGELLFNKINIAGGKLNKKLFSVFNAKIVASIIIAVFLSMENAYYIFFSYLGMVFAILVNFLEEKSFRRMFSSSIILLVSIIFTLINMIPYIVSVVINGNLSGMVGTRISNHIELYSLNFIRLILPIVNHRIHLFSEIRELYETQIAFIRIDTYPVALGLFISLGFMASFFILVSRRGTNKIGSNIHYSAVLILFLLMLGTTGGISSIIGFIAPSLRSYYRISVFIAFYSLYIAGNYLDKILIKIKLRFKAKIMFITLLGILFTLDQVPGGG